MSPAVANSLATGSGFIAVTPSNQCAVSLYKGHQHTRNRMSLLSIAYQRITKRSIQHPTFAASARALGELTVQESRLSDK